jgi:hypothetical protein
MDCAFHAYKLFGERSTSASVGNTYEVVSIKFSSCLGNGQYQEFVASMG